MYVQPLDPWVLLQAAALLTPDGTVQPGSTPFLNRSLCPAASAAQAEASSVSKRRARRRAAAMASVSVTEARSAHGPKDDYERVCLRLQLDVLNK